MFNYNKQEILNTPSVDETKKVYDFADLIDNNGEAYLYNKVIKFINAYNVDLVLVTIDDNWTTARKYADNFYRMAESAALLSGKMYPIEDKLKD